MAGLAAPNGAGGMDWFHLVWGTSAVEMKERQGFPALFMAFTMVGGVFCFVLYSLFVCFFYLFCFLKLTSAADVKESLFYPSVP